MRHLASLVMVRPPINLDKTLGAVFVGNIVAAMYDIHYSNVAHAYPSLRRLFGFTSVQMYIFFRGNTRDRSLFKYLVCFF